MLSFGYVHHLASRWEYSEVPLPHRGCFVSLEWVLPTPEGRRAGALGKAPLLVADLDSEYQGTDALL